MPRFEYPTAPASCTAPAQSRSRTEGVDGRGRGLLDHLLVAALHRTVALEQVQDVALLVAYDLHLDMPPVLDEPLDEERIVTESGQRFAAGANASAARSSRSSATTCIAFPPPPATAFTRAGKPIAGDDRGDELVVVSPSAAGRTESPASSRDPAGPVLAAHHLDHRRRGADEDEPRLIAVFGKGAVLGQGSRTRDGRPGAP